MKKLLGILFSALIAMGLVPAVSQANANEVTWYICVGDFVPMKASPSTSTGTVGYIRSKTQYVGRYDENNYILVTDGPHEGKYIPEQNSCWTSNTGAGSKWLARANTYISRSISLDNGALRPDFYSRLAQAIATTSPDGWRDDDAQRYLDRALSTEIGNGGFGLPFAWDAFADGTVNSEQTTYTVTVVTHLGDAVLAAFEAGALKDPDVIQRMVDKVESIPSPPMQPDCVSYSDNPNDVQAGYCTHNVNAAAAVFLLQAADLGFDVNVPKASRMLMSEVSNLRDDGTWLYMTGRTKPNDPDHGAYQLKSVHQILPELTQPIINDQMSKSLGTRSAEAHTVLAQLSCLDSNKWWAEHDASAAKFVNNADRMAYYAMEAADAAVACGGI